MAGFIPSFGNATLGGPAMFGAQQIPGADATLRVADVSFEHMIAMQDVRSLRLHLHYLRQTLLLIT